jgi:hypothetical protein
MNRYPAISSPPPEPKPICVFCPGDKSNRKYLVRMTPTMFVCSQCLVEANDTARRHYGYVVPTMSVVRADPVVPFPTGPRP